MSPEDRQHAEETIRQITIRTMGFAPERVKAVSLGDENELMAGRIALSIDFEPKLTPAEDAKFKNVMRNLSTFLGGQQPIFVPEV